MVLEQRVQAVIHRLQSIVQDKGIKGRTQHLLEKAARIVPKMKDTLEFVIHLTERQLEHTKLKRSERRALRKHLILAAYLSRSGLAASNYAEAQPYFD